MKDVIHKTFDAKAESGDEMVVGGFVTTGSIDRHSDVVDPDGVDTTHLKVLLESHDHTRPVGTLLDVEKRAEGVYARFKVASEEAWAKIKSGLYPSFSIGFLSRKAEPMKDGGWIHRAIEVIEVSLVAVPSNRESSILEIRSTESLPAQSATPKALEGNIMSEAKTVKVESAAVHTERHEYSLAKALEGMVNQRVPAGLEGEVAAELQRSAPGRQYGGIPVPLEEIFLTKAQRDEVLVKASGVISPSNLSPTAGIEHLDSLYEMVGDAISRQMIMGQCGVKTVSGITEQTARIPTMTGQLSSGTVAVDANLPDSADPTFANIDTTPSQTGSVAQLNLSSVLSQHPAVGTTDYFAAELRRALTQEIERLFINGDPAGGNAAEPSGLVVSSDDTGSLTVAAASAIDDLNAVRQAYDAYVQTTNSPITWIVPPQLMDSMMTAPAFTGSTYPASETLRNTGARIVSALNLPETAGTYTSFAGDFSYFCWLIWSGGLDISVNPFADSVFSSRSVLVRAAMMHSFACVDPKRILQVAVTP